MRTMFLCTSILAMSCAAEPSPSQGTDTEQTAAGAAALGGAAIGGAAIAGPGIAGPPPAIAHLSCGAVPQRTMTMVCGRAVPSAVHLAWTGCSPEPGMTTTGSVDVALAIRGDCSAGTWTGTRDVHVVLDVTRDGATSHRDTTLHGMFSGVPPLVGAP